MAVRLLLATGGERLVADGDSARLDGHFFLVTGASRTGRIHTLLTLRAEDVVAAEVLDNGVRTAYIPGTGQPRKQR